jgi:3-oxoacyl-[acyl-carrier-protein] synthase-3
LPLNPLPLKLVGIGRYLPSRIVPSSEVEARCGLPAGWVERNNGVRERRWVGEERNADMGAAAAREALADAGLGAGDIDLIINASGTSEQYIPDTGPLMQRALGWGQSAIPALTLHATCLSFVAAIDFAASLIATGRYTTILIITAEIASLGLNFAETESATLLGDAAAAVVVTRTPPGESSALLAVHMETYSDGADYTQLLGGGSRYHPNAAHTRPEHNLFHMEGSRVARFGIKYSAPFLEKLRPGLSTSLAGVDWVTPHQASLLMLRTLTKLGWPEERIVSTLATLGNCIAASIPVTLYEAIHSGKLQRGQEVLLVGTGAGLSLGGAILRY